MENKKKKTGIVVVVVAAAAAVIVLVLLSKRGSYLKGMNLIPMGANSFLLEQTPQTGSHKSYLP